MSRWQMSMALRMGQVVLDDPFSRVEDVEGWLGEFLQRPKHDGSRYDPSKIYARATNRHDHDTSIKLRVDKDCWSAVNALVGKVPAFGSPQAFVRDAVIHALNVWKERIGEHDGEWSNIVTLSTLRAMQEQQQDEVESRKRFVEDAEKLMGSIAEARDVDAMVEALDFHLVVADRLPEPWKGRVEGVCGKWKEWVDREVR
jgi:hypothetical protein